MKETRKRVVKLIAKNRKYQQNVFMAIAPESVELNTYLTGQHNTKEERENLTREEMLDSTKISVEKRKKFPFVINPDDPIVLNHFMNIDLSTVEGRNVDPRSVAIYDFIKYQNVVAKDEASYLSDKHLFYLYDEETVAEQKITKQNKWYEAMKLIKENTTIRRYADVALMLSYKIPNFDINIKASTSIRIESKIMEACHDHPEDIIDCFADGADEFLFVLKLIAHDIIDKKRDSFYDGDVFLGKQISEVITYMNTPKNERSLSKWGSMLERADKSYIKVHHAVKKIEKDKKEEKPLKGKSEQEKFNDTENLVLSAIDNNNYEDGLKAWKELEKMRSDYSDLWNLKDSLDELLKKGNTEEILVENKKKSEDKPKEEVQTVSQQ